MARQTFRQIVAAIQRYPSLDTVSLGQIIDAVASVSADLGNQPWPWNYAESNVIVPAAYTTGTVSVANGSPVVNGTLTVWDPLWYGQRIRFGNSNLDYTVDTIVNPTQLLLAQPVNLSASLVDSTYIMYQDTYMYPDDYIVGSDVAMLQPTIRARIPKIPRYKFEMAMNAGLRSFSTNIQMFYCDHGEDQSGVVGQQGRLRFRLGPPPSGPAELRLCYHQMAPSFSAGGMVSLPDGFDEIIELMSASKLYDLQKMPGLSEPVKLIALGKLKLLRRAVMTQTIDDVPNATMEMPDSSISQWGLMISRM
jgi:hypothetical protein